jgi:hypothetical protein
MFLVIPSFYTLSVTGCDWQKGLLGYDKPTETNM